MLVLDFRSPEPADIHSEAELLSALLASSHRLMPWLLSLLTLGIFWVAQQTQLSQLARSNRNLTWLHLTFLAIITVLPFTTRLLADFFAYRTAFLIYWANIFLLGVAVYVTWAYAERAKLIRDDAPAELSGAFRRRVIIAQSLYAVGVLVGLVNVPLGLALIILVQLNYAVAPRLPDSLAPLNAGEAASALSPTPISVARLAVKRDARSDASWTWSEPMRRFVLAALFLLIALPAGAARAVARPCRRLRRRSN